jgi:hypothetical protein
MVDKTLINDDARYKSIVTQFYFVASTQSKAFSWLWLILVNIPDFSRFVVATSYG